MLIEFCLAEMRILKCTFEMLLSKRAFEPLVFKMHMNIVDVENLLKE